MSRGRNMDAEVRRVGTLGGNLIWQLTAEYSSEVYTMNGSREGVEGEKMRGVEDTERSLTIHMDSNRYRLEI